MEAKFKSSVGRCTVQVHTDWMIELGELSTLMSPLLADLQESVWVLGRPRRIGLTLTTVEAVVQVPPASLTKPLSCGQSVPEDIYYWHPIINDSIHAASGPCPLGSLTGANVLLIFAYTRNHLESMGVVTGKDRV